MRKLIPYNSHPQTVKVWYTALELTTLGLPGIPTTESGVLRKAARENWRSRPRQGSGGGREYHVSNLPQRDQDELLRRAIATEQEARGLVSLETSKTALDAIVRQHHLTDGQRDVMEARVRILEWIDSQCLACKKEQVIAALQESLKAANLREQIRALLPAWSWEQIQNESLSPKEIRSILRKDRIGETLFQLLKKHKLKGQALIELIKNKPLSTSLQTMILRANAKSGQRGDKRSPTLKLSRRVIFLWYRLRKEGGVAALAPQLTREPDLDIPDWAPGFLALYQRPSKPSLAATLEDYRSSLSDPALAPSYDQVRRTLKKLSALQTNKGRMGTEALKRFKAFTRRDISELWPAACYTADGHCFKAKVLHPFHGQPFRPELTAILDIFTGYVTGWHAGLSENALDVLYALSDAMIERGDGRHRGISAIFYTDNGPGFKNRLMNDPLTGFCVRWGIETPKSIAYNSQARGKIEVLNKSLWIRAARKLESYCGKDADKQRLRELERLTRAENRDGKLYSHYLGWEEFLALCQEQIDAYNTRPHRALPKIRDPETLRKRHMTPKERWEEALTQGHAPMVVPLDQAAELHRPYVERTVSRCEVRLPTGIYFSRELQHHHGESVMVGYDIHDASRAWVRDAEGRLITVAELDGNSVPYFPTERVTAAAITQRELLEHSPIVTTAAELRMRQRTKNRLATNEKNRAEILAEARGPAIEIEAIKEIPLTDHQLELAREFEQKTERNQALKASANKTIEVKEGERPRFGDDLSWVAWLLEHPEAMTELDQQTLKKLCRRRHFIRMLENAGLDPGPLLKRAA